MTTKRSVSVSAATGLTTAYAALALTGIPDDCWLSVLHGEIDTIAASAASITWYIAADSGGDVPVTAEVTTTIVTGKTTATDGGVTEAVDWDYVRSTNGTAGSLWVFAKTDAGTCNLTARIYSREEL
jgi:hypothetical protein